MIIYISNNVKHTFQGRDHDVIGRQLAGAKYSHVVIYSAQVK